MCAERLLLDLLFQQPLINVNLVKDVLDLNYLPANRLVNQFEQAGLLEEITGGQRNRRYRYNSYLDLFDERRERLTPSTAVTESGL